MAGEVLRSEIPVFDVLSINCVSDERIWQGGAVGAVVNDESSPARLALRARGLLASQGSVSP